MPIAAVKIPIPESTVDLSRPDRCEPNNTPMPLPTNMAMTFIKVPVISFPPFPLMVCGVVLGQFRHKEKR